MRWSTAWNSTSRLVQRAHEHRLFRAPIGKPFGILVLAKFQRACVFWKRSALLDDTHVVLLGERRDVKHAVSFEQPQPFAPVTFAETGRLARIGFGRQELRRNRLAVVLVGHHQDSWAHSRPEAMAILAIPPLLW